MRHSSSAGSPPFGSITKQLKCHWENKFPAEISGKEFLGGAPREFHCCHATQAHDGQLKDIKGQCLNPAKKPLSKSGTPKIIMLKLAGNFLDSFLY